MDSWTRSREVEEHICPLVQKTPNMHHSTALSMSASAMTISALLPPSSAVKGRCRGAQAVAMAAPVGPEPVKLTFAIPGARARAAPAA